MRTVLPYILVQVESEYSNSPLILEDQLPEMGKVAATHSESCVPIGALVLFGKEVEELSISHYAGADSKYYLMEESNIKLIFSEKAETNDQ